MMRDILSHVHTNSTRALLLQSCTCFSVLKPKNIPENRTLDGCGHCCICIMKQRETALGAQVGEHRERERDERRLVQQWLR